MAKQPKNVERLNGVNPLLVKVVLATAQTHEFMIVEGIRSREQCFVNYGKGRTAVQCASKGVPNRYAQPHARKVTWLNDPLGSKHCIQSTSYGHAVDLFPAPYDWNNRQAFQKLAEAIIAEGKRQNVNIRWGRDWDQDGKYEEKGEIDGPHFELVNGGML